MADVIVPGVAGAKAVMALVDAFKLAHKQGWLDRARDVFRRKHTVLVLGATGTGKTNVIQSMTELMPAAISYMNRTQFATKHRIRIDKQPFTFIDTPGELAKKALRTAAMREALSRGISGVINVTSYGYHEFRTGRDKAVSHGKVVKAYLEEQREAEIARLDEWVPLICGGEAAGWVITLVNKADLWWDRRESVLKYYEVGPYGRAIRRLTASNHLVLDYSAVFSKFYSAVPMCGAFDDAERARARAHLLKMLVAAVGKADGHG